MSRRTWHRPALVLALLPAFVADPAGVQGAL